MLGVNTLLSRLNGLSDVVLGANLGVAAFPNIEDGTSTVEIAAAIGVAGVPCQITHTGAKSVFVDSCVDTDLVFINKVNVKKDWAPWESLTNPYQEH